MVDALVAAVRLHAGEGAAPVRVLSAPCGLARDVLTAARRLAAAGDAPAVAWTGVDIDENGEVLPEAARRADEAGVEIDLLRDDLFATDTRLSEKVAAEGPFHVANCIGLTAWVDLPDVARLARRFAELLAPGGTLIIDNFHVHKHSHLGAYMEMPTRYHPEDELVGVLRDAGFSEPQLTALRWASTPSGWPGSGGTRRGRRSRWGSTPSSRSSGACSQERRGPS